MLASLFDNLRSPMTWENATGTPQLQIISPPWDISENQPRALLAKIGANLTISARLRVPLKKWWKNRTPHCAQICISWCEVETPELTVSFPTDVLLTDGNISVVLYEAGNITIGGTGQINGYPGDQLSIASLNPELPWDLLIPWSVTNTLLVSSYFGVCITGILMDVLATYTEPTTCEDDPLPIRS